MKIKIIGSLGVLALLLAFPLVFPDPTMTGVAVFTLILAGAAVAWNIFSGYTGYFSLGQAVYYGIGGYTLAMLCKFLNIPGGYIPFLFLPIAGLVASVFAIPVGLVALRTRRHIFIVFTIALFFIFQLLAYNLTQITNGVQGMYLPLAPWTGTFYNMPFYYVSLILLIACFAASWWIRNSKYGLGLLAIRDDEDRALGLGVKTFRYKLMAYVVSAFFIGMAGGLINYFIGSLGPASAFDPSFDVTVALMSLLGGVGTLVGPLVGAVLIEPLQQYLTVEIGTVGLDLILFGVVLLAVILWLPEGILPTLRKRWAKRMANRATISPPINTRETENIIPSISQQGGKV
jgi:ABC-type branched-subunit amino acid transport system permease subunit